MKVRIASVLALSIGLTACQADDPTRTGTSPMNAAAVQEDFLTVVPRPALTNAQRDLLAVISGRPSTAEVHVARMAASPGRLLQQGRPIRLGVAPGRHVVALSERVDERGVNDLSWAGAVQGEHGVVQMVLSGEGVTATVRAGEVLYHVEPLGDRLHAITRVDPTRLPPEHTPEHTPETPSGAADFTGPAPQRSPFTPGSAYSASVAASTSIDVLVVYTAAAASATGSIGSLIQLAVDETQKSYANSGISIALNKVHVAQVSYNESSRTFAQHVDALRSATDGIMDIVHSWRNTYAADVVVLVVNDGEACGRAAAIKATESSAFAAVHYSCATGTYSFGHEIGHLQGARHDTFVDGSTTPYAYGHGYVDPNNRWRTVMAYANKCGGCTRVQYWSNPYVPYPSTGQAMGTTSSENNARVLNETAGTVAAFRSGGSSSTLSVNINGPGSVSTEGTEYWDAAPSGGDGSYVYQWKAYWIRNNAWETLGTAQTQPVYILRDHGSFELHLTATSAGQTASTSKLVCNFIPPTDFSCN